MWVLWGCVVALWACDSGGSGGGDPADAATLDAGRPDARGADMALRDGGPRDAGPHDQGPPADAAPADMASPDASPPDAGPMDAAPLDAAPLDAAPLDAAPLDAAPPDAALPDMAPLDAAVPDAEPPPPPPPPLITELMARNDGVLLDEDGDPSDWIELYNPGDAPYALADHHLTDSLEDPTRWRFPAVAIPARGYLVVFASGKNRRPDAGTLHTDFSLSGDGETIALTGPDGEVLSAFVDYPPQAPGLSFGLPMEADPVALVGEGSPASVAGLAPGGDAAWRQPGFIEDANWSNASLGVGYDQAPAPRAPRPVADSVVDFGGSQGLRGWSYGYRDAANDGGNPYNSNNFIPFPAAGGPWSAGSFWTGQAWDWFAGDPPWTSLTPTGGQPNGFNNGGVQWAIRRFTSPIAGRLAISGQVGNPAAAGDGATLRLFVDGEEAFSRHLNGATEDYAVEVQVAVGSLLDFTIDPGPDGDDFGDGAIFTATLVEPGRGLDALGPVLADSVADWSAAGIQGERGWWQGYYDFTGDADGVYGPEAFRPFPRDAGPHSPTNFWTGDAWDWFSGNPPWTTVGREAIHPNGTNNGREHWAMRRFEAPSDGTLVVEWHLDKSNPNGGGVTGHVFHGATELDQAAIAGNDSIGVTRLVIVPNVRAGDTLDFAVDPTGPNGNRADGSDGSRQRVRIWQAASFAPLIQTDVEDLVAASGGVRLRVPVAVPDPQTGRLELRVRYDDGFRAWLDGAPLVDENAGPAVADRAASDALAPALFSLGAADLAAGLHLLAVEAVDAPAADGRFLFAPTLDIVALAIGDQPTYLPVPTPGADNLGVGDGRPVVITLDRHQDVGPADELAIGARVAGIGAPVADVTLVYRVMFEPEVQVPMMPEGDSTWRVVLPPGLAAPGQLVRWYVVATDAAGRATRWPPFLDPLDSEEYVGTVIRDDALASNLPILHWFAATPDRAATDAGTRTSLWFDGELYDNIRADLHGQSSRGFPKKSYNLDFNADHRFRWQDDLARMRDINLLSIYADKSKVRNTIAYEIYRDAGADYHLASSVRMQLNGRFFSVADFVEDGDDKWIERLGYPDPIGALYKMYDNMSNPARGEKKTRREEGNQDLAALIAGLGLEPEARRLFIYDNIDLARMANYLAAMIVTAGLDCCHKNYYAYRDPRTDEWWYMPWDQDLTLGRNWTGNYFDDRMYPQNPLFVGRNNRLISALFELPPFTEMYLRRLRTLMDAQVQPPGTPAEALRFEARVDALRALIGDDGDLDNASWPTWGIPQTFDEGTRILKEEFLGPRRTFLYGLVQPAAREAVVLVDPTPGATVARYSVPLDDLEGDAWTLPDAPEDGWAEGPLGLGYEDAPGPFVPYLATAARPQDADPRATSVRARIHFTVDDPAAIENLVLRLRYDDGVIVWLNGVEVTRRGLPPGPVAWDAEADDHPDAAAIAWEDQAIQGLANLLVAGDNVLAVQVVDGGGGDLLLGVGLLDGQRVAVGAEPLPPAQGPVLVAIEEVAADLAAPREAYVLLHNITGTAVDLSGWRLAGGGVEHVFRAGTVLPTDGRLYVVASPRAFRARANGPSGGQGLFVQGPWTGVLFPGGAPALLPPAP
ncbi:MAG: CotH kinase family protein [bacterium]